MQLSRLRLWFLERAELVHTSLRVCEENERLKAENAAAKAALRRTVTRSQRQARELADLKQFLSIVGDAS